jgi:hypothetical protein
MGTSQDVSLGFKKEVTFGTKEVVDRWLEFVSETFDWKPEYKDGASLRVGTRVQRADRRRLVKDMADGGFTLEAITKGLGRLFEAAMGVGVSTNVAGAVYQQVFTALVNEYLPSYTFQKGIPMVDGTVSAQTYFGCMSTGFELDVKNGDLPTLMFDFIAKGMDTSTSLATPSYASGTELFAWPDAALVLGGTVTAPTSTALASGGTEAPQGTDITLKWENPLDSGGFGFNGNGQRTRPAAVGKRVGSGTITAEYISDDLRDAWENDETIPLLLTFEAPTAISGSSFPTLQFFAPAIKLEGEMPKSNAGDIVTEAIPFSIYDDGTSAEPLTVVIRTAETAI